MIELPSRLSKAVRHFWQIRNRQSAKQGQLTGTKDTGSRTAVTGGRHMDGFVALCRELLIEAGLAEACIYHNQRLELPGYFRAEKCWDVVVVVEKTLLAAMEFKAQVGPSFSNNFNNRTEEALGSATDLWAAYREGIFQPSQRPWLGYLFLLEECAPSLAPVKVKQPHFPVFPEFNAASYAQRYQILLTKLVRERLYDATCLLLSTQNEGLQGKYSEPSEELSFTKFAMSLMAHAMAYAKSQP